MKRILYLACLLTPAIGICQTETTTQQTTTMPGATINMTIGGTGVTTQQTTVTTTTTTTSTGDQTQQAPPPPQQQAPPPPSNSGCSYPMPHDDYESAKSSIAAKDFEDTKLTLAKQVNSSNCMSAEQIRGIMKLFTFENSKLDFAKSAYSHCSDKGNYFKVNDAFEFDNSSKELNDYIGSH
ncbi:MAG TPA: DUF4476 domain-containing protein [Bacteroidia bacterium]|jgi:hypothetical protein|nr:DUF4476 domain-containing protein [Bacteroidia bacterium]